MWLCEPTVYALSAISRMGDTSQVELNLVLVGKILGALLVLAQLMSLVGLPLRTKHWIVHARVLNGQYFTCHVGSGSSIRESAALRSVREMHVGIGQRLCYTNAK